MCECNDTETNKIRPSSLLKQRAIFVVEINFITLQEDTCVTNLLTLPETAFSHSCGGALTRLHILPKE